MAISFNSIRVVAGVATLVAAWAAADEPEAPNLAPNPSFETAGAKPDGPEGWSFTGGANGLAAWVAEGAAPGARCVRITNPGGKSGSALSGTIELNQEAPCPLEFGGKVKTEGLKGADWRCGFLLTDIVYADGSKAGWQACGIAGKVKPTQDWVERSRLWRPEKPVRSLRLRLLHDLTGSVWFDDVFLREVELKIYENLRSAAATVNARPIPGADAIEPLPPESKTEIVSFASVYAGAEVVWQVGSLNNTSDEFSRRIPELKADEWEFDAATDDWGKTFPQSVGGTRWLLRPQEVRVRFAVTAPGAYTFVLALCDCKNIWNTFQVLLDGKTVREYTIEGNSASDENDSFHRFADTLSLTAGEHTVGVRYKNPRSRYEWIVFDAMALLKGEHRPVFRAAEFAPRSRRSQRVWCEPVLRRPHETQAMGLGSLAGPDFDLLLPLPDGDCTLELGFSETVHRSTQTPLVGKLGERQFDVYVNGSKVLTDYDIIKASRGTRICTETVPVKVTGGRVALRLVGKKRNARISRARAFRGRELAASWDFIGPPRRRQQWRLADHCFASPTNLVPNPGFELVDEERNVHSWVVLTGNGRVEHCTDEAHQGKACLKVSAAPAGSARADTMGFVCADKPYALSFRVKTSGRGRVRPKLYWYRWGVLYRPDQVERFEEVHKGWQTEYIGVTPGQWESSPHGWRKATLTTVPPHGATAVSYGFDWEGDDGDAYVDDACFDGLGALPVELLLSQGGYDVRGVKRAVVFTQTDCGGAGEFILRKASNDYVKSGPLELLGRCPWEYPEEELIVAESRWNRTVWVADFSDVREPGRYNLEVVFADGQTQRSPVFDLAAGKYGQIARYVITNYFPTIRCGVEVPGWHPPCHRDDADILQGAKRVGHKAVFGGWHDAGDMNIFLTNEVKCALAMGQFTEILGADAAVAEEACWGLDHIVRCQFDDGSFANRILGHPQACPHLRPDKATDGDPATPDNRAFKSGALYLRPTLVGVAALHKMANQLEASEPERARQYREAAERALAYWERKGSLNTPAVAPHKILIGLAAGERMTEERRREFVTRAVEVLVETLEDDSCLTRWPPGNGMSFQYLHALLEFAKRGPEAPLTPRVKEALRRFFDATLVPVASAPPFLQAQELRRTRRRFAETYHSYDISYKYSAAYALAAGAEILRERRYLSLAEAQIQWGLGLNPVNICAIAGLGWRPQAAFNLGANDFVGHEDGQYPGATHHCIMTGSGVKRPRGAPDKRVPAYHGAPVDFPICGVLVDYPSFPHGGEPCISHTGPFLLACVRIESALRSFE